MMLTQQLKNAFRKYRKNRWNRLYDIPHHFKADQALKSLASQGKTISPGQESQCLDYANSVLGSKAFSPWLKVYTAFQGEFKEGWIPDNYIGRIVSPAMNGPWRGIGQFKTLSRRIVNSPSIPDLAYFIKGSWVSLEGEPVNLKQVKEICFQDFSHVFLKMDFSQQGKGIIKLDKSKFDGLDYSSLGDFVLQKPIKQHSFLEEISPGSVATLRVTTVKLAGNSAVNRLSGLRIGSKGEEFITSKNSLRIPIFLKTGDFFESALKSDWSILSSHPETGEKFKGLTFPHFHKVVRYCEMLHDQFPHFQLIAWDVSVDDLGEVFIMEWNTDEPGIIYSEATIGPHFRDLGWENLWKKAPNGAL